MLMGTLDEGFYDYTTRLPGISALAPRYETIDGQERPVAVSDFWPGWHASY